MIIQHMIASLENFGAHVPGSLRDLSDEDARWKPPTQNWSILEIICHLIDEEREDFRSRIQTTLDEPGKIWPSINPELWAVDRRYNERDFQEMLEELSRERIESVKWLKSLDHPNWYETYEHPHLGPIRAGDLLVAWVAHDHLHVRQISKRRYEMVTRDAGSFTCSYAGDWAN